MNTSDMFNSSPCSFQNLWMSAHPKIVIAAPHCYVLAFKGVAVIFGLRKCLSQTVHPLENTIRIVLLLLLNLTQKELIIVKVRLECLDVGCRACIKEWLTS